MSKLIEFVGFVNSQAEFHERMAVRFQGDTRRFELHSSTAKKCRDLAVAIEENEKILNTPASLKEPKASALMTHPLCRGLFSRLPALLQCAASLPLSQAMSIKSDFPDVIILSSIFRYRFEGGNRLLAAPYLNPFINRHYEGHCPFTSRHNITLRNSHQSEWAIFIFAFERHKIIFVCHHIHPHLCPLYRTAGHGG